MPIYELAQDTIRRVNETTFASEGIRERGDLQRLLRGNIDVVAPGVLVIAEEFSRWADSNRRIDLLGVDRDGSLVVVELKRTEDGAHMELQAIRYAAMVSPMTYEEALDTFADYLTKQGSSDDARQVLHDHLGWDGAGEPPFNRRVRIVLISLNFDKEITTTVLWLADVYGLDIRCVRLRPHRLGAYLLIDVQQIIPVPEAAEYRVQLQKKAQQERVARDAGKDRDQTRYDVTIDGTLLGPLSKRQVMLTVVKHLCNNGVTPEAITKATGGRRTHDALWKIVDGEVDAAEFSQIVQAQQGGKFQPQVRLFCEADDLIRANSRTYALTKMWSVGDMIVLERLQQEFQNRPGLAFDFSEHAE